MTPEQKWKGRYPIDAAGSAVTFAIESEDFDWSIVENQAGVAFTTEQRDHIVAAVREYFIATAMARRRPKSKDFNRRLNAIARHANALADALASTDAEGEVARKAVRRGLGMPIKALTHLLRRLALNARYWRADAPEGRPRKTALRTLVCSLHEIWNEAGGCGPLRTWDEEQGYGGRFFDFAYEVLTQIAGEDEARANERGIDEAIRELNDRMQAGQALA